jgi:hypothetical protein
MVDYGTTDRCTDGTPSASSIYSATYSADKGCDDNGTTRWATGSGVAFPHWWKYDFGAAVKWRISKITITPNSGYVKNFTVQGSNNDSTWATLYTGQHENNGSLETFTFTNKTEYRYIMINFPDNWVGGTDLSFFEAQVFEGIYPPDSGFFMFF